MALGRLSSVPPPHAFLYPFSLPLHQHSGLGHDSAQLEGSPTRGPGETVHPPPLLSFTSPSPLSSSSFRPWRRLCHSGRSASPWPWAGSPPSAPTSGHVSRGTARSCRAQENTCSRWEGGGGLDLDLLDLDHCFHQREQRGAAVRRRAPAPGMRGGALLGSAGSRYGSWFASGGPARNSLAQGSTCSRWEGVNLDLDPSLDLVSRGAARNCFVRESTCSKWERGGSGSGYRSESGYSGRGSD